MTQQTGHEAATVHRGIYDSTRLRWLALPAGQPCKGRNADKTIKYHFDLAANQEPVGSVFVVDEASMLGDAFSKSEFSGFAAGKYSVTYCATYGPPLNCYRLPWGG
jgi:hypothetical protein